MADLTLALLISVGREGFGAFSAAGGGLAGVAAGASAVAAQFAILGAIGIGRIFSDAVGSAASFELSMARVQAVTTGAVERFVELETTALELGKSTFFTAQQVSEAMFELGQAGLNAAQLLAGLEPVLDLAQLGFISTGRAGEIATDIMAGMGLQATDLTFVVDVLAKTFTSANTTVDALGTAFSKIGPLASTLDIDITELSAAMGVLANRGIKGEEAGTALRNIFLRLLNPSRDAAEAMALIGLRTEDLTAGNLDLIDILGLLDEGLKSNIIGIDTIAKIFQARATPAVLALIGSLDDGEAGLAAFTETLANAGGEAERMNAILEDTAAFAFAEFKATVEALKIELGAALMPVVLDLVDVFKENTDQIQNLIAGLASLVPLFIRMIPFIQSTIDGFVLFFGILSQNEILQDFLGILEHTANELDKLGGFIPVIITGLILLAAPIVALIAFWTLFDDQIKNVISLSVSLVRGLINLATWVGFVGIKVGFAIKNFLDLIGVWEPLVRGANAFVEVLKTIWDWLQTVGKGIAEFEIGGQKIFLESAPISETIEAGSQAGNRRVRETGMELVHAGEEITNPLLGQENALQRGRGAPTIGTVENHFHVMNPDSLMMEREVRKFLNHMDMR